MIKKTSVLFLFLLIFSKGNAQNGTTEVIITIEDKKLTKNINDSLISAIKQKNAIVFSDNKIYAPLDFQSANKILTNNNLSEKNIISIKILLGWDIHKNQASILSFAPIYKGSFNPHFYVSANFKEILGQSNYLIIKQKLRTNFFKLVNSSKTTNKDTNVTLRNITSASFNCINHINLLDLAQFLKHSWQGGQINLYNDYDLALPISHSQIIADAESKNETLIICEKWSDTTVIYNTSKQATPLFFDTDYLKKEINSIGFSLDKNKIAWVNYKDYKLLMNAYKDSWDSYRFIIYDLFFQSSFCTTIQFKKYN